VSVDCCQIEVSATSWSLVQRSPTGCGVSECDCEASIMMQPRPPRGCRAIEKKIPVNKVVNAVMVIGVLLYN
jgi:hypothetical protein